MDKKKKRLIPIPFNLMPASWGLKGQAYEEAEAAYYYEGEALERKLVGLRVPAGPERDKRLAAIDLAYRRISQYEHDCKVIELDGLGTDTLVVLENEHKHHRITDRDYLEAKIRATYTGRDREKALIQLRVSEGDLDPYDAEKAIIELDDDTPERKGRLIDLDLRFGKLAPYDAEKATISLEEESSARATKLLDLDLKFEKITKREHEKQVATIREEPWVGVIDDGFDVNQGVNGLYFELDWNEHWITYLRMNGYGGNSESEIIEAWFADVCRTYVSENGGEADFQPRPGRVINRFDGPNGTAHYT